MKHLKTAPVFMLFAFCMGSLYILGDTYQRSLLIDKVSLYLIVFYLLVLKYQSVPYSKIFRKIRWAFPIFWVLSAALFNIYLKWDPPLSIAELAMGWSSDTPKSRAFQDGLLTGSIWVAYKPAFLALLYWKTYALERRYNYKSDSVNTKQTFICLWRPQSARTLVPSLMGVAVGSVCIYSSGRLYGFRWDSSTFQAREVDPSVIERRFIAINTLRTPSAELTLRLNSLIGSPAGKLRVRCVYVIRDVLTSIHPDFKPTKLEYIPSRFGIKLLRWRDGR